MDIDNAWFDTLSYPLIDPQQQTYVTKHDLELLHKKIIATDLIVQKYQDANKALLRLQNENDDLKTQIEQITNECCIFGKQITECTQECDNLKEHIDILSGEKRELHQQLRQLQDENTNNYHEIMVLKQYESLKETNDQLTKTVDRQQKQVAKLQLQLQRKSTTVYRFDKNKHEPSETDIALKNSQKSIRELKLALGRLVNFIQISKIEIPTSLHIRPVLKAHEINDDFLETEGEFVLKPVQKVSEPVINQIDDDDDDDDNNGDFIDVNHIVEPPLVNTTIPVADIIEETPVPSKSSLRQQKKKKETSKSKGHSRINTVLSENSTTPLEELANELEIALSQPDQQQEQINSQLSSVLSDDDDDDDDDKIQKSDKQQSSIPIFTPTILQPSTIHQKTNSSIKIIHKKRKPTSKHVPLLSDDDDDEEEISQPKLLSLSPEYPPITESQVISISSINEQSISLLQVDSITPMDMEISNIPTKYMSSLSEDDDDIHNASIPSIFTSVIEQQSVHLEYISPLELNKSTLNKDNHGFQSSDKYLSLSSSSTTISHTYTSDVLQPSLSITEDSLSHKPIETISENIQDSFINENNQTIPFISTNTLDSNRIEIVLRLLNVLTKVPIPLKRLRLVRHRIQQKQNPIEQVTISNEAEFNLEKPTVTNAEISEHPTLESSQLAEENNRITDEVQKNSVSPTIEEQRKSTEQISIIFNETPKDQVSIPTDEQLISTEENNTATDEAPNIQISSPMEEQSISIGETNKLINKISEDQISVSMEELPKFIEENNTITTKISECPIPEQLKSTEENNTPFDDIPNMPISSMEVKQNPIEENHNTIEINTSINEVHDEQQNCEEENSIDERSLIINESSMISSSQESTPIMEPIQCEQPLLFKNELEKPVTSPILEVSKQSSLKPFQISIIHRLLNMLTNLPIKPLTLPKSNKLQRKKQKPATNKPSVSLPHQTSNRMQTRSLSSIRACIARCNQPPVVTKKRSANELPSSSRSSNSKRIKSIKMEENNNEYNLINKYLNTYSKEINDELKNILQQKLYEDIVLFSHNIYEILSQLMFNKCDIILPLVKHLHPYEESIKILLTYINGESCIFQHHFIIKLNQVFEYEIKKQPISINRIKILNRLFFLTSSIITSSVITYTHLFDIGYYLSHDILTDAWSFISNICSSLISNDSQKNSSNILLHQILFDLLKQNLLNISLEYVENLFISYHKYTHDQDDLIRCFILISRHQTWLWCSKELCSKFFFPLLNKIDNQFQQRRIILIILQYILFIYKDNEDFKQDIIFHDQIKQLLISFKIVNSEECIVRDKIFFILHTYC